MPDIPGRGQTRDVYSKRSPAISETAPGNLSPTPAPTGRSSASTTVHITDIHDFALLLPANPGELISDAESDGVAFCTRSTTGSGCSRRMTDGFIRAAAVKHAADGSYVQVTGCLDTSKSSLSESDDGGQFDVRFPNGAQCTFGGYAASFIEQCVPSSRALRVTLCLRCCAAPNDQENCNSHRDTAGCVVAIPGTYDFPDLGSAANDLCTPSDA
ncbi:hypothetical protein B0H21DRAFT_700713 [Amylocystis lapponica]|nr:hypothetical protein B0H21DRAFT_700713 [Amylocystis lapponica]